ncbi:keywimysin-related RiPP [Amycolatopsis mediterranei]
MKLAYESPRLWKVGSFRKATRFGLAGKSDWLGWKVWWQ